MDLGLEHRHLSIQERLVYQEEAGRLRRTRPIRRKAETRGGALVASG